MEWVGGKPKRIQRRGPIVKQNKCTWTENIQTSLHNPTIPRLFTIMPKSGEELAVRVAVRVRPLVASELQAGANTVVGTDKKSAQAVLGDGRTFAFDFAYGLESTQENIYDDIVKPLEKKVLMGYNATLLAYGQTGSGKTYTMGTAHSDHVEPEHVGVTPRVIRSLFDKIKKEEVDRTAHYKVRVSFLEIHNEQINDLLFLSGIENADEVPDKSSKKQSVCIRENAAGEIVLAGLFEEVVSSAEEVHACLKQGNASSSNCQHKYECLVKPFPCNFYDYAGETKFNRKRRCRWTNLWKISSGGFSRLRACKENQS